MESLLEESDICHGSVIRQVIEIGRDGRLIDLNSAVLETIGIVVFFDLAHCPHRLRTLVCASFHHLDTMLLTPAGPCIL